MPKNDPKAPVTNETLHQAVDAIIEGVDNMFKVLKRDVKTGFDGLKSGQRDINRRIDDLQLDTPSRKEFDKLKKRVDKYHPMN